MSKQFHIIHIIMMLLIALHTGVGVNANAAGFFTKYKKFIKVLKVSAACAVLLAAERASNYLVRVQAEPEGLAMFSPKQFYLDEEFEAPAYSREEFANKIKDPYYFQKLATNSKARIAFSNPPGYLSIGLCWWHTNLQRAGLYLTVYQPNKPKPNEGEVREIVRSLLKYERVIEIAGYGSFYSFTEEWKDVISDELSKAQLRDAYDGAWAVGIFTGSASVPAEQLKEMMYSLYYKVHFERKIVYQMVKWAVEPNVHAWLVLDMEQTQTGFLLHVIDSISPEKIIKINYAFGFQNIYLPEGMQVVPYVQREVDFLKIQRAIQEYVRGNQ